MYEDQVTDAELTKFELRDINGKPSGIGGIPSKHVLGRVIFVDGYSFIPTDSVMRMDIGKTLAGYFPDQDIPSQEITARIPAMCFTVPDYPCEFAATYVMGLEDAEAFARAFLAAVIASQQMFDARDREAIKKSKRLLESMAPGRIEAATQCFVDGCQKSRAFFDEAGNGYCKKHADERGFRPTGKVS